MKRVCLTIAMLLLIGVPTKGEAEEDLISIGKSDTGIKALVFPLSMKVIQNRPLNGFYYFYEGEIKRFDDGLDGETSAGEDGLDALLSDPRGIKKNLVKADPVRVAPASQGEAFRGTLTREALKILASEQKADILLIFRRKIKIRSPVAIPLAVFQNPGRLLESNYAGESGPPYTMHIKNEGLLYLTRQSKILILPTGRQEEEILPAQDAQAINELKEQLGAFTREGLKKLGESAKKVLLSHKFFKRQSGY